jgi:tRNA (mo5U34)-methyltransferase
VTVGDSTRKVSTPLTTLGEADLAHMNRLNWFHRIPLAPGVVSPGSDVDADEKLAFAGFPESFAGQSVLDVGAWDGLFSFEAERRGARRVLATDSYAWGGGGWGTKEPFEFARRVLGSRVEDLTIDVLELTPERVGTFDVVLFLGVLYHMRHPLLALERVASVCGEFLLVTTSVDMVSIERPAAAFYPGNSLNDDVTNWWGPNPACVRAMLVEVGFAQVKMVALQMSGAPMSWEVPHHVGSFHARKSG